MESHNDVIVNRICDLVDNIYFDTEDYDEELDEIISDVIFKFMDRFDLSINFTITEKY